MTWHEIVAKFTVRGLRPDYVGELTLYQAMSALYEMLEESKFDMRLAGATIEEEEDVDPAPPDQDSNIRYVVI